MDELDSIPEEQIQRVSTEVMATMGFGTSADEASPAQEPETAWYYDGQHEWCWQPGDDEWLAWTSDGWIAYSEFKPWMDIEDVSVVDPAAGKELNELFSTCDAKVRSFREARDAMQFKGIRVEGFTSHLRKENV